MLTAWARGVEYTYLLFLRADELALTGPSSHPYVYHRQFSWWWHRWNDVIFGVSRWRGQALEWPPFAFWVGVDRLRPSCYCVLCIFSCISHTHFPIFVDNLSFSLVTYYFLHSGPHLLTCSAYTCKTKAVRSPPKMKTGHYKKVAWWSTHKWDSEPLLKLSSSH